MKPLSEKEVEKAISRTDHLIRNDDLAKTVFTALANKERPRRVTDLRRLRYQLLEDDGINVTNEEITGLFEKAETVGLGELIKSSDPIVPHRFEWYLSYLDIGRKLGLRDKTKDKTKGNTTTVRTTLENVIALVDMPGLNDKQKLATIKTLLKGLQG